MMVLSEICIGSVEGTVDFLKVQNNFLANMSTYCLIIHIRVIKPVLWRSENFVQSLYWVYLICMIWYYAAKALQKLFLWRRRLIPRKKKNILFNTTTTTFIYFFDVFFLLIKKILQLFLNI
jgi:hypothetical protein